VWILDPDLRLVRSPLIVTDKIFAEHSRSSSLGVDAVGNFVVAWQYIGEHREAVMDRILAQRFTNEGEPVGPEINVVGPVPLYQFRPPSVAMDAGGRFVIVWEWEKYGIILGQRYDIDGEKIGRIFQVDVNGPAKFPMVASDRGDRFALEYWIGIDPGPQTVATRVLDFNAPDFIRGDVDGNDSIDLTDAIMILYYLFFAGTPPVVRHAGDVNDDNTIDLSDPIYLLYHLYLGGPRPPHPFPMRGFDPTP